MDVQRLIDLLPQGLHSDDPETRRVLLAMLEPVAVVDDFYQAKVAKVAQLLDPSLVPDALVPHLAGLVGVGRDLPASKVATVAELRKLIPVAVALWKMKGTQPSWRALAAGLAGSRSVILDWFYHRTISGSPAMVSVIPAPLGTGGVYTNPERVTDLWIMDPAGLVNLELLIRFLDVARPTGERINLYQAWLVDDCGAGGALWTDGGAGGSRGYNPTTWELVSRDGYRFDVDAGGLEAAWADYHATLRLGVEGVADVRILHTGPDDYYRFELRQDTGRVRLYQVIAGVETLLFTRAGLPLVALHPYLWAVEAWAGTGSTTLRLYRDGSLLIDVADATVGRPAAGGISWQSQGAGDRAVLSTCLVWPSGTVPTRIGPTP